MCDISVIIPVYNSEEYLDECLKSVLSQTGIIFEVICVNDASSDASKSIIEHYASIDDRVILIDNKINSGTSDSRNNGIRVAKGRFCYFLDSDDYLPDDKALSTMLRYACKDDLELLCFGGIVKDELQNNEVNTIICLKKSKEYPELMSGQDSYCRLVDNNEYRTLIGTYLYDTNFIKDNNLQFMSNSYSEDMPFIFEAHFLAERARVVNDDLYCYRLRNNSKVHSDSSYKRLESAVVNITHLYEFINENMLNDAGKSGTLARELDIELGFWKKRFMDCSDENRKRHIASLESLFTRRIFVKEILDGYEYYIPKNVLDELRNNKVILYGAGYYGKKYLLLLNHYDVAVEEFAVTESCDTKVLGYSPKKYADLLFSEKVIVIPAVSDAYKEDVLKAISCKDNATVVDLENYKI